MRIDRAISKPDRPGLRSWLPTDNSKVIFTGFCAVTIMSLVLGDKSLINFVGGVLTGVIALLVFKGYVAKSASSIKSADNAYHKRSLDKAHSKGNETRTATGFIIHPASPLREHRAIRSHIIGDRAFIVIAEFPDTEVGQFAALDYLESRYGTAVLDKTGGTILIGYSNDIGRPVPQEAADSENAGGDTSQPEQETGSGK